MFIFEILIYAFFAWVMCMLAKRSYVLANYKELLGNSDENLWPFWLFFAFICAIRWNVGVDCVSYIHDFAEGIINEEKTEYLWQLLVLSVSRLHLHYAIGMGGMAFLQLYFLTKRLSEYRYVLVFMPIALFGGCYFLDYCNGMRQMLVASMFVFSTKYILEKKFVKYAFMMTCAYFIHHSAVMLFPMYVFAYLAPRKWALSDKRMFCLGIFATCFILGITPQFSKFLGVFDFLVENMDDSYSYVGNVIQHTIVEGENEQRNFGPMQLSYFLTALSTIVWGPVLRRKFQPHLPYFDLWWFFAFIFACGYFLVCNVSFMFVRVFQYFEPFQLIIVSLLFFYLHLYRKKYSFTLLLVIIWAGLIWNIIKSVGVFGESVTYKMIFFHDINERIHPW